METAFVTASNFWKYFNLIPSLQEPLLVPTQPNGNSKHPPDGAASLLLQSLVAAGRSPPAAAANKAIDRLIWAPFPFRRFLMLNTAAINKLPAFLSPPPLLAHRRRRHLLELI